MTASLSGSVGAGGKNFRADVTLVQDLLKSKGFSPGPMDGVCGRLTIDAIKKFQAGFLQAPDGLIEPGGITWTRLTQSQSAPMAAEWKGDSSQWPQDKKLRSLDMRLRPKVQSVLADLSAQGFQPKIFFGWRSVAVQRELYRAGNSKVTFSFHNAQRPDGTPNAYAADIIDARFGWSAQADSSGFWRALGIVAKKQGLYWGGDWSGFRDWAHAQLLPNSELARAKCESGL